MNNPSKFRNLAIIAHVDHGKTTLVDQLLQAGGTYRENQAVQERAMDSMDLEREKGITIKAKNTSIQWNDYTINIVDTPGHADFGGEVERVMKMVDGVLLVVDAFEGPQAQTRFVLRKALQEGLMPIVVINKIDRPHADAMAVHDKVLELFLELDATEEQFNAPFVYGSARDGYFMDKMEGEPPVDCTPLINKIIKYIPSPKNADPEGDFQMLVSNIDWDDYVGRVAVGRITSGTVKKGDNVWLVKQDGTRQQGKVTRMFEYSGLGSQDSAVGIAGNIVGVAGFESVNIGETLCGTENMEALPFVAIDPPTISMEISINDGPFGGRDGKNVTSRVIRDRLMREMRTNVSIQVEDTEKAGVYSVSARGAMQIAVLVETMRREKYEVCVSRPNVILKKDETGTYEPYETMYVEIPDEHSSAVLKLLNIRKGQLEDMETREGTGRTFIQTYIPTRGIIGFEFELVNLTSGHGIFSHLFRDYGPYAGEISTRQTGTLVSMETGVSTGFSLLALEERGKLFVGPQEDIYAGQIVGENPRAMDLPVNPCKEKHLNNIRSATKESTAQLSPPVKFSLERAIEYIEADELVEVTPHFIRMRKRILDANERKRSEKRLTAQ